VEEPGYEAMVLAVYYVAVACMYITFVYYICTSNLLNKKYMKRGLWEGFMGGV